MTSQEKSALLCLLNTAEDYISSGFRTERAPLEFQNDDAPSAQTLAAEDTPQPSANPAENPAGVSAGTIAQIAAEIAECRRCGLCERRRNTVPGEGVESPLVLVAGEAPGADEDAQGRPFVGAAGQLLDKMLLSIDLDRKKNCFIANVLKCRPPGNRDPAPEEKSVCISFLERQISVLRPRAILCAGRIAAQTLLVVETPIGALRGGKQWSYKLGGIEIPLFATYHPSALLRDETKKRPAWEDLKSFRAFLDGLGNIEK